MDTPQETRSGLRRAGRLAGLLAAALVVTVPVAQLLVWSWEVQPLLVVPAYVLGIPLWLTVLAQAWSGARRVQAVLGTSTVPVPAPRREAAVPPLGLRTPTP